MSCRGAEKRVALVKGDGVGPEVIDSALAVLAAAGADLEFVPVELGYGRWKRTGKAMAEGDLDLIKTCHCILFGAITTPPDPEYRSVLLALRKGLDLYANIRPFSAPGLDFVIVRENTEGMYSGVEKLDEEEATTLRVITHRGSLRIAERACAIASKRQKLTIVHKSNVLKSDTLFLRICGETAHRWDVPFEDMLVDAAAYNLIINPKKFDVIVTTNLFGDILSDEAAGIVGGLGLCPSANLGDKYALFEPIHGSAPDIAGKGIANPVGAIRSAAMMLEWFGEAEKAKTIVEAVEWALAHGIVTPDLGGNCSTKEVAEAIAGRLV
ncbi:MAG: isocitrate/isopropylmalate dehydrogenase family protein [Methanothrix sp.]|jgi:methanogen homoisocitrate dehydrogenase|uniref:Isopropylmalate/isohomocitrate dehydrogenase n=1 Tax=Methanothrix harundinacea TaxID=301375 RepID=A0A101FU05_9EURY|nr:MAG: Isopropylmalate/isohomocitrate dehydrogenase [Methanothrix harundinacea]MDD3709529.1 isocitrate/isopropylmalate dehydrogenase family protein [Methanothrix sp.]MDI9399215.1 isocitrate/isopropylmalate dehydrogenase family protein [Euryarchaeota archaeon]KUK96080.1 MAG: Isopropylmalate/isohomocitrate dehydrogenase [Methanothrix harundinacea]MCP1393477.1 isocitrate/isopropylmalate dehydrogenase family protein [Methanothrix harundinacea]